MDDTGGNTPRDLEDLMRELEEEPWSREFFEAVREIECRCPEKSRFGKSAKPSDEPPVRFCQEVGMSFEPSTLARLKRGDDGKPHKLYDRLPSFFGNCGFLPRHLTEYALERRMRFQDETFSSFLDLFHHRYLSIFYRYWASSKPTVSFDRGESDQFMNWVASVLGLGQDSLRNRDEIHDQTKLYYCGRLGQDAKNANGLGAIVADYFGVPAKIEKLSGEWVPAPTECRARLANTSPLRMQQARAPVLGARLRSNQHKFRLRLGPLTYEEFLSFLPTGTRLKALAVFVRNYIGDELAWDVKLILKRDEVPRVRMTPEFRMGYNTWLGKWQSETDAEDLVIDVAAYLKRLEEAAERERQELRDQ